MTVNTGSQFALALDRELGPGHGDLFDFSIMFESAILTIAPLGVLIVACPFHIWHYRERSAVARIGTHFWLLTVMLLYLTLLKAEKVLTRHFRLWPFLSFA